MQQDRPPQRTGERHQTGSANNRPAEAGNGENDRAEDAPGATQDEVLRRYLRLLGAAPPRKSESIPWHSPDRSLQMVCVCVHSSFLTIVRRVTF